MLAGCLLMQSLQVIDFSVPKTMIKPNQASVERISSKVSKPLCFLVRNKFQQNVFKSAANNNITPPPSAFVKNIKQLMPTVDADK